MIFWQLFVPPIIGLADQGDFLRVLGPLGGTGGTSPYSWNVVAGALPPGLTLASTGVISGITTTAGTFNFTAQATDRLGLTAQRTLVITAQSNNTTTFFSEAEQFLTTTLKGAFYDPAMIKRIRLRLLHNGVQPGTPLTVPLHFGVPTGIPRRIRDEISFAPELPL